MKIRAIIIHGRGEQGSVTAAELLAVVAFDDGEYSQAFPAFSVEKKGRMQITTLIIESKQSIRFNNQNMKKPEVDKKEFEKDLLEKNCLVVVKWRGIGATLNRFGAIYKEPQDSVELSDDVFQIGFLHS